MQFKRLFPTLIVLFSFLLSSFAQEHTYFVHGGTVRAGAYSPVNASLVASAGESGVIKLWHLQNSTVTTLRGHTDKVNAIAFSPNGQLLVSGSDDYTVKVWDISRRQEIENLQHRTDNARSQIKAVAFAPNGQRLATAGMHVKLWDTRNWREVTTLQHDEWVWTVAFSPDDRLLATGGRGGNLRIWNVQQRRIVKTLEGDTDTVYAVAFSPDNRRLASAGWDGKVTLWRRSDWGHLGTLTSQHGTIFTVDFSPDGKMLASTGHESVNLWAVDSGENIATLRGHAEWVNALAFSPGGAILASGGDDGTLRIWDITPYQSAESDMVRLIYFLPRGRTLQPNMWTKLNTLIREVQKFYADEMQINGFGRKTFTFETDGSGDTSVWRVDGQFNDWYYHTDTHDKVYEEIAEQFDMSKHLYLIVVDISSEFIENEDVCGVGGGRFETETGTRRRGGYAIIPASGHCFDGEFGIDLTAHELGHAFGLGHDFRNDAYIMSYGSPTDRLSPDWLSKCAAEWLDASRFFNTNQTAFNEPTTFQMLSQPTYPPNAGELRLQFEITDADGLHQAQLLIPTTADDPAPGTKLHSCKRLHGQNRIVEFMPTALTSRRVNDIVLQVIDVHGNITQKAYTLRADDPLDVNRDGTVDVADLVLVASNFGKRIAPGTTPNPDVDRDGVVDISDLILVANQLGVVPASPSLHAQVMHTLTPATLQHWIHQAKALDVPRDSVSLTDEVVKKGIAVLEHLLATLRPVKTVLLVNYPNPFNPETWIPYQLTKPAEVTVSIHSSDGTLIRRLTFGQLPAGVYQDKSRAAYWDGRNTQGEPVASGVYFYTLSAGDFTATRKMLILK